MGDRIPAQCAGEAASRSSPITYHLSPITHYAVSVEAIGVHADDAGLDARMQPLRRSAGAARTERNEDRDQVLVGRMVAHRLGRLCAVVDQVFGAMCLKRVSQPFV